jgi:hypothetical protein
LVEICEIILYGVLQVTVGDQSIDIVESKLINCRLSEYHTVWRGISEDLSGLYRESDVITWWSLSSTTSSFEILQSPMYLGRAETRTMFSIETKNGRLIHDHSHLRNDDEILLPPGIVLKVLRSVNPTDGVHIIYLREIESSCSRFANSFNLPQMNETWSIHQGLYGTNATSNTGKSNATID